MANALWDRFAASLAELDRPDGRWQMPPCPDFLETDSATLWLDANGRLLTHGPSMRRLLFLLQEKGLGPPAWSRCDDQALPPEICAAATPLFFANSPPRRELMLSREAGHFHFVLERMQATPELPKPPLCITIRHHEPTDLAVARRLWGWAMSPQEKRILIATARHASLAEMADSLDISLGTLKAYNNELLARFQTVETHPDHRRQGIGAAVVHAAGRHALDVLGTAQLVIVAETEADAIRIYRRLGFEDAQRQVMLERRPAGR